MRRRRHDGLMPRGAELAQHRVVGILPNSGRWNRVADVPPVGVRFAGSPVAKGSRRQECLRGGDRLRSVEVDIYQPAGGFTEQKTDVFLTRGEVRTERLEVDAEMLPLASVRILLPTRNRNRAPALREIVPPGGEDRRVALLTGARGCGRH